MPRQPISPPTPNGTPADRLRRRRYGKDHWDSVITGYREVELLRSEDWPAHLAAVVAKLKGLVRSVVGREVAFLPPHLIDLAPSGLIAPHVDSVKFSGGLIAGLSLASPRIMRLTPEPGKPGGVIELLLEPRSLYVLTGPLRYEFAHEVLGEGGAPLLFPPPGPPPERRLSIILRDPPPEEGLGRDGSS